MPLNVILGGSFNPPTLAHYLLLGNACAEIEFMTGRKTDGIFVPSSHNYVARKVGKIKNGPKIIFSESQRAAMLGAMCAMCQSGRLSVDTVEFGDDGKGRTYDTMRKLADAGKARDPGVKDSDYVFLTGADKLNIMPRWRNIEKFLSEFRIAVTSRNGDPRPEDMIRSSPVLARYEKSFLILGSLDNLGGIPDYSSTQARGYLDAGDRKNLEHVMGQDAARMCLEFYKKGSAAGL